VSIVIPAYEQKEFFARLLKSIFSQTLSDYEIVVTDDSKTNAISSICQEIGDSRLFYYKNSDQKGSPENWNEGLRKASGKYIKIMHHDDWFTTDSSLECFVKMLEENPQANFAFSGSLNVSDKREKPHFLSEKYEKKIRKDPRQLFIGNYIGAPSATIYRRRDMFFDKKLKWLVDLDFYIRLLLENSSFVFTKDTLVSIGQHDAQVTNECLANKFVDIEEHIYVYNKFNLCKNKVMKKHLQQVLSKHQVKWNKLDKQLSLYFRLEIYIGSFKYHIKKAFKLRRN
jgi:glycosyltransferase involved in cell wall biosynthesis